MPERFPEVRVNIVDHPGWEPWNASSILVERASDAAHDEFSKMPIGTVRDLIEDLAGDVSLWQGPKEWSPRKISITYESTERIAREVKEGSDARFENTRFAILDVLTWMYEAAMSPHNGDIRDAMTRTVDHLVGGHYDLDRELWEPILDTNSGEWWSENAILRTLMNSVDFYGGGDERYLVFSFGRAIATFKLLKKSPWPQKKIDGRLKGEFTRLRGDYLDNFFHFLKREMEDVDIDARTTWHERWKGLLASPDFVKPARDEIRQALRRGGR